MGTYTQNLCFAFNPSKVHTHSSEHMHTHREHTPGAVGRHLCCGARGAVGGSVPCSRSHLSRGIEGGESAVHSLPPPTIPARTWDSNSQPFNHESDSLNIRPRLSHLFPHPVLPSIVYVTSTLYSDTQQHVPATTVSKYTKSCSVEFCFQWNIPQSTCPWKLDVPTCASGNATVMQRCYAT